MAFCTIGFDFYGTGNVGDDLMLEGFLLGAPAMGPAEGFARFEAKPVLEGRFPSIAWRPEAERTTPSGTVWAGVGDTPIQILSGHWFLERLEKDLLVTVPKSKVQSVVMVGVGVEEEALRERVRFQKVLASVERIGTRDKCSLELLRDGFGVPGDRLVKGADLSNIALSNIFREKSQTERVPGSLAIDFFRERTPVRDWISVARFLRRQVRRGMKVTLTGTETRQEFEAKQYAIVYPFLNQGASPPVDIVFPVYTGASVSGLVEHFRRYECVMASRYHCLLTAAWAGARVCGISRSSKIAGLCSELGLPVVEAGASVEALEEGFQLARRVPREQLLEMERLARASLRDVFASMGRSLMGFPQGAESEVANREGVVLK